MTTKINTVAELPEWFSLEKYALVPSFTAQDWLFELTLRTLALNQIAMACASPRMKDERSNQWKNIGNDLIELVEALRAQPVRCKLEGNWLWDGMVELTDLEETGRNCVQPLTIEYLYLQKNSDQVALEDGTGSEAAVERWKHLTGEIEWDSEDLFSEERFPSDPISINRRMPGRWEEPILIIDLNTPDALLLDAFKEWLKKQRLSPPAGVEIRRKPAYEWWSRYGLLPYLDLLIWSRQTGTHIPDRIMADAISSYNAGEGRLRQTIKPIVADLQDHLEGLRELAAAELAGARAGNI